MRPMSFAVRAGAGLLCLLSAASAAAQDVKVRFGTNWLAQAEHGGYYQAVADGTYRKYGLDVTIVPGVSSAMICLPVLSSISRTVPTVWLI